MIYKSNHCPTMLMNHAWYACTGASVRQVKASVLETSPLQAVVWFILGPMVAMPPGDLQSAYATDALAFILQHLESAGPKDRASLHALSAGNARSLSTLHINVKFHLMTWCRGLPAMPPYIDFLSHCALDELHVLLSPVMCMHCSAGLLCSAMAARCGREGDAPAAAEVVFDMLATLLQQPLAGVTILRAAAAELLSTVRQHAQQKRWLL